MPMHTKLIGVQTARRERFDGMSNKRFYDLINSGRLKTLKYGARRYTTDAWINECIAALVAQSEVA